MSQLAKQYRLPARPLSPAILEACEAHVWPGNIRELRDFAKRYLVVGDEELAVWELKKSAAAHRASRTTDCLPDIGESTGPSASNASPGLKSLVRSVRGQTEKSAIAQALEQTNWNRKAAANLLQVSYRTLLYKIELYHMNEPAGYISHNIPASGIKHAKKDERTN
jgi:two-component system response regulator AtoC